MITTVELYISTADSVTFLEFQGHTDISEFILEVVFSQHVLMYSVSNSVWMLHTGTTKLRAEMLNKSYIINGIIIIISQNLYTQD